MDSFYKDAGRDFSYTQIRLPDSVASELKTVARDIPENHIFYGSGDENKWKDPKGKYGRAHNAHITVKYGIEDDDPRDLVKALRAFGPVKAALGKISLFEQKDHDVVKAEVSSEDLHRLNALVREKTNNKDFHPEYIPHATIAYVKKGKGEDLVGSSLLNGHEFSVNSIVFTGKGGENTVIHLGGEKVATSFEDEWKAKQLLRDAPPLPAPEQDIRLARGMDIRLIMDQLKQGLPLSEQQQQAMYMYGAKTAQKEGNMKVSQIHEEFMQEMRKRAGTIGDRNRSIAQTKVWSGIDPNISPGDAREFAAKIESLPFIPHGAASRASGDPQAPVKGAQLNNASLDKTASIIAHSLLSRKR